MSNDELKFEPVEIPTKLFTEMENKKLHLVTDSKDLLVVNEDGTIDFIREGYNLNTALVEYGRAMQEQNMRVYEEFFNTKKDTK
jgi:hypothetical protein